jgi:H+/Cl- antiporter ClcA
MSNGNNNHNEEVEEVREDFPLMADDSSGGPSSELGTPSYGSTYTYLAHHIGSSFHSAASSNTSQPNLTVPPPPPPHHNNNNNNHSSNAANTTTNNTNNKISSLDFERVINEYSIQATRDRYFLDPVADSLRASTRGNRQGANTLFSSTRGDPHPPQSTREIMEARKRSTRRSATRWILSAIVGLVTGLTTIFIVQITGMIVHWRSRTLDWISRSDDYPISLVFAGFCALNLVLALSASMLCVYVAPEGTGSGIPEVKAYLNGVRVKKFTSWKLFVVKIVGTILSVSSSLAVGMEGPLIHIGAIVGASFTKTASSLSRFLMRTTTTPNRCMQSIWTFTTTNLAHFSIDAERRDLISIGASVGFAASFGAPIGGLLFILDDISSYFSKNMFLRTLVANAIGTFCLAVHSGNLSNYSVINLGSYNGGPNEDIFLERFEIVPLFLIIAVAGGALGGIFCATFEYIKVHVVDRLTSPRAKLLQVAVLSLITSALTFGLPYMAWACKELDPSLTETELELELGKQFFCEAGHVNEMATMMFGSRDVAIKRILSDPEQFQERTLWAIGILFYGLMTLTYGSILPSGIFTPTVLIGASLGGAAGLRFQDMFDHDIPSSTFALLGVAAMLAGIQRSTVSISVILVEGTGQIKVLLPVIIVVLVARYVASFFHADGLYETSMALKHYPYMDHEPRKGYDILEVQEIMSSPPIVIGPVIKASHLVHMLQTTSHNGYPVVDPKTQKFLGLVRRDQILALLECGVFQENDQFDDNSSIQGASARSEDSASITSTPRPGIAKSPLMHWAYHIKDDRYDYLKSANVTTVVDDNEDDDDRHEMIRNIRAALRSMPGGLSLTEGGNRVSFAGNDTLPPLNDVLIPSNKLKTQQTDRGAASSKQHRPTSSTFSNVSQSSIASAPKGFAEIGVNDSGNLIVTWLNPGCRHLYVNIALVMNRGAYCVPDHLPVSKARKMFTKLGLRHVVVLGGKGGGNVVGVFTRANLMEKYIREKVGLTLY